MGIVLAVTKWHLNVMGQCRHGLCAALVFYVPSLGDFTCAPLLSCASGLGQRRFSSPSSVIPTGTTTLPASLHLLSHPININYATT